MILIVLVYVSVTVGEGAAALAINENLFVEEDLEGLEDELEDLDLEEWSKHWLNSSIYCVSSFICTLTIHVPSAYYSCIH